LVFIFHMCMCAFVTDDLSGTSIQSKLKRSTNKRLPGFGASAPRKSFTEYM
jgi:hypothetical protein